MWAACGLQVLSAGCAAGVSATFGAPVGGVLFSIEVTSTYYSISHLWKAMFTSVCGALLFRFSRTYGELSLFELTNFNDVGHVLYNGEMIAFVLARQLESNTGEASAGIKHGGGVSWNQTQRRRQLEAHTGEASAGTKHGGGVS